MIRSLVGFFSLYSFFFISSYSFSNESVYKTHLLSYLKTQYLGKRLTIVHPNTKRKVRVKVRNVSQERVFRIHLDDNLILNCVFFTRQRRLVPTDRDAQKLSMTMYSLKTQETINNIIKNTGGEGQIIFNLVHYKTLKRI